MTNKVLAFCAALILSAEMGQVEAKKNSKLGYLLNLQHEIVDELDHVPAATTTHHTVPLHHDSTARHMEREGFAHERAIEDWTQHADAPHVHQVDMHAERHSWAGVACPKGEVKIGCCKCVAANSEDAGATPEPPSAESDDDKPEPPSAPEPPSEEEPPSVSEEETPEPPSEDSDKEDAIHFVDHKLTFYEGLPHHHSEHRTQHGDFDAHHIAREHHEPVTTTTTHYDMAPEALTHHRRFSFSKAAGSEE